MERKKKKLYLFINPRSQQCLVGEGRGLLVNVAIRQDKPHSKQSLSKMYEDAALCPNAPVLAKNRLFIREKQCLADFCNCKMPIKGKTF